MPSDARSTTSWVPPGTRSVHDSAADAPAVPAPDPAELEALARDVLPHDEAVTSGFSNGVVAVQADQTHYSGGFALFMGLRHGCAVAIAPADTPRLTTTDGVTHRLHPAANVPPWVRSLGAFLSEGVATDREAPTWHVAVANTLPSTMGDGALAALLVALRRALAAQDAAPSLPAPADLAPLLATVYDRPCSIAYPIAADAATPGQFILVDTATHEHLPVPTEAASTLAWAVIDIGNPPVRPASFYRKKHDAAEDALALLQDRGFPSLQAFRDLEHRDLERAGNQLPPDAQPVVRHLVTENRRVQRHVAVLRRGDWQMVGALLRMSHATLRDHWASTSAPADALVSASETLSMDGLYGACMTERDGAVLVTGRPSTFDAALRSLLATADLQHGRSPRVLRPV